MAMLPLGTPRSSPQRRPAARATILMGLAAALLIACAGLAQAASAKAVFAGGCFWCMEPPFDKTPGVTATVSGYAGGSETDPTYEQVSAGSTGHYEAIEVTYDPGKVSYEALLDVYWRNVDPFDGKGQFCDRGPHYRAAIFASGPERKAAEASKASLEKRFGRSIATAVLPQARFWPAEGYHQDYYRRNSAKYKFYRLSCRRDARLQEVWGAATN